MISRLKQGLQLHLLPERAQTYVHLGLIVWSLQEQGTQELSLLLAELHHEPEVGPQEESALEPREEPSWVTSHWALARCEMETLRVLLPGSWTRQRLYDCLPALRRYLLSRQREKRLSQETEVQPWLLQQLGLPQKEATAA